MNRKKVVLFIGILIVCATLIFCVVLNKNSNIKPESSSNTNKSDIGMESSLGIPVSSVNENVTSTPSKPTSAPPAPKVEGAGGTDSKGNQTKATNPALTNKDKTPEYTSKPVVDGKKSKSGNTSSKKSSGSNSTSTPKAGDHKDGKSYVPGFGWVDGNGAGGEGTVDNGDWGGGEQVGIMD
ncbi:exported protein of unknown function [Ruminococcaceae bacterium BL-6]|nr:exported protein of unknown function [Ruminococcaceae bacterium BL-6]